jgi:hypothetical protein
MPSDSSHIPSIFDQQRIAIAQQIVERKRQALGDHLRAAACYGSVAHYAASEYSDVEIVLLTDESIETREELFFVEGTMVECDMLPVARMLRAVQRVTKHWGVEADQYRCHLVLLDLDAIFPELWERARNIPDATFMEALSAAWWWCYESHNKLRNACLADDGPRIHSEGWFFANTAAMHIALHERRPYESGRTLWQDVVKRGYGMGKLVGCLTDGPLEEILPAVDDVWGRIGRWGAPEETSYR